MSENKAEQTSPAAVEAVVQNTTEQDAQSAQQLKESKEAEEQLRELIMRHQEQAENANARMKKRLVYLIPFNALIGFASFKYAANLHRIANKFWPNRQKFTFMNVAIVGTAQSIIFCSIYVGGTCATLGINPRRMYREAKAMKMEEERLISKVSVDVDGSLEDQLLKYARGPEGTTADGATGSTA